MNTCSSLTVHACCHNNTEAKGACHEEQALCAMDRCNSRSFERMRRNTTISCASAIASDKVCRDRRLSGGQCITIRFSQPDSHCCPKKRPRPIRGRNERGLHRRRTQGLDGLRHTATIRRGNGHQHRCIDSPLRLFGARVRRELERLYTSMRQENVFRPRLLWLDSVVSSEPLEQQIAASTTPEILQKIADAHRQGRRLYVGTTNLDTKSLVVWDLGAIAARNTPESRTLFQKVLLASCSVPGLLPPVPIDIEVDGKRFTELHVDGGVTACVFLQPAMLGIGPNGEQPSEANTTTVYAIVAGKLHQTAAPTKRELFSIAGESMNAVLQAKMEGELTTLFMLARYARANFKLTGIPQDYETPGSNMSFDQKVMRGLVDEGVRAGRDGTAWRSFPPGLEKVMMTMPRTDIRFAAVRGVPSPNSLTPDRITITLGNAHPTNAPDNTATRPSAPPVQLYR